jgi:diguanylate cyclase (GGDEF)-like protein/PAS domain S-box-containing protein
VLLTVQTVISLLCGILVLVFIYWYLYLQYQERCIKIWAVGLTVYSIRYVFDILMYLEPDTAFFLAGQQLTDLLSGYFLLWGAHLFVNKPIARWWVYCFALTVVWGIYGLWADLSLYSLVLPIVFFAGLIYIWIGGVFLQTKEIDGLGKYFTGGSFILWGLCKINFSLLKNVEGIDLWGYVVVTSLASAAAIGILLAYYQKIRRDLYNSEHRYRLLAENTKQTEDTLRASYGRFREMLENLPLIIITIDRQGYIVFCNKYFLKLIGCSENQVIGREWFELLVHDETRADCRQALFEKLRNNAPVYERIEKQLIGADGQSHTILWNTSIMHDSNDRAMGITCIGEDMTERRKSEEVLKRYQLMSKYSWDCMVFSSQEGRILEANNAALQAYGYSRDEILSKTLFDLRPPEEAKKLEAKLKEAEYRGILYETIHQRKDGTTFPVEASLQGAKIGGTRILLAIMRDITERKRAEETINHLAYHDPLTDLPNRSLFYDRLAVAIATAKRNGHMLAVMFLDLDRFKYINDVMGHTVGDELLKEVAGQLVASVRRNDTVARIGGDEFTILLPQINHEEDAAKVADHLIEVMRKPRNLGDSEIEISASIGIALFPNDGQDAETLTINADIAMYRAKEERDNYQFFTAAMNIKNLQRILLERDMKKAVDSGELIIYYQPRLNIKTGRVVCIEALLRWQHPEKGFMLPNEFIPLAEDTGLIVSIGKQVLRNAIRQAKDWQLNGFPPVNLAINLSARQLRHENIVDDIASLLAETGLDPSFLELEITESTAMLNMEFSISILKQFREMGINIAIDDFGTGYSSLNYLRRFPITTLKVDRSFVRDVLTDVEDAAIVATIINLANNMKLRIVVEGVETKEQMAFFKQQDCFEMQGYLFSEPLPADQIMVFLQKTIQQDNNPIL